jgi:hypothetical protein
VARPSPPLCDAVRHGQQQPRRTVPPTPVRPARRTVKEGRRSPQREGEQLRHARAKTTPRRQAGGIGHLRRHRPCATILVVSDAIPATASPSPTLWKRAVNGTLPRRQLYPRTAPRHGLESSHGWPPNKRPLHHHPQSRSWTRTGCAMTSRQKQDSPGRSSTPRRCTPCLYT